MFNLCWTALIENKLKYNVQVIEVQVIMTLLYFSF